jgi:hypothetical protein
MQRLSDLSPSIIWVFLFFTLSLSSATRQFIWLMALVGLIIFARGPRDFLATDGVRKFWIVLACFLLPAIFSLFDAINFERSLSGAVRFLSYGFAVWVLLQIKLDRSESARLMSLVGAVMMLWVVDGLVQLLTGYSVFGNPLIELDSGDTVSYGQSAHGVWVDTRDFVAFLSRGVAPHRLYAAQQHPGPAVVRRHCYER